MNKIWLIGLVIVFLIVLGGVFFWYNQSEAQIGTLNIYNGRVDISRGAEIKEGQSGSAIYAAEKLKLAPESRASVVLSNGIVLRLEAGTEIEIVDLSNIVLKEGRVWSQIDKLEEINYQIETPTITVAVRGTSFDVSYQQLINKVFVENGIVSVFLNARPSQPKEVKEGQVFVIKDATAEQDFAQEPINITDQDIDDWIEFNVSKDNPDREIITPTTTTPQTVETTVPQKLEANKPTATPTTTPRTQSVPVNTQTQTQGQVLTTVPQKVEEAAKPEPRAIEKPRQ